ncbi:MAG: glycosyltransferase family 2 protein [Sulfolobales archaeon]|nr:glycosyltransferase family 2 protein [Sulfolobales archaeon]MDW8082857.1 glycosyltransferase family 2 protein [Sulfolobales archaeon]
MLDLVSAVFSLISISILSANSAVVTLAYLSRSRPVEVYPENLYEYPEVTIVVPAYRERSSIHHVLQSLKEVRYPRDKLKVVVVGESDDIETYREISKFCKAGNQLLNCGEVVGIYIENSSGVRGKPAALNYALRYINTDILAVYDAEDTIHPDHVLTAVKILEDSDVVAVQFIREVANTSSKLSKAQIADFYFFYEVFQPYIAHKTGLAEVCGSAFFIKVPHLVSIGGFNISSPTEDLDLTYRIGARRWKVVLAYPPSTTRPISRFSSLVKQRARWIRGGILSISVGLRAVPRSIPLLLITGFTPIAAITSTIAVAVGFAGLLLGFEMTLFRRVILVLAAVCVLGSTPVVLANPGGRSALKYLAVMSAVYYLAIWRAVFELLTAPRSWTKSDFKA